MPASKGPSSKFDKNVFINCPFDEQYLALLHPMLFTILYLGLQPRIALERFNAGEQRIEKICELITESKYSIHDISRLQSERKKEFYRLNMPFELGIDYGTRKFGPDIYRKKEFLVLARTRFDYMKAISDLSGVDIRNHDDQPLKVVRAVRNWLGQSITGKVPAPQIIWDQFNYFVTDFFERRTREGFSKDDVYEITSNHLGELIKFMSDWIRPGKKLDL